MNDSSLSQFSNKAVYANRLEISRRRQQTMWVVFWESCGQCESGGAVKNLLAGVTALRVGLEYDGFTPDICLERGDRPPIWIEFSAPTVEKLAYCAGHNIDLFEIEGRHPSELSVGRAHISPRNCCASGRKRLRGLWEAMRDLPDPMAGIREDFRSPQRKQREWDQFWQEAADMREAVAQGRIRCVRCERPYELDENGGFQVQHIPTHRPNGECGYFPMCLSCDFSIAGFRGGDDSEWWEWQPQEGCPTCQPLFDDGNQAFRDIKPRRSVEMPEPYGSRLVHEQESRSQGFIVGEQTVRREEMQSILAMVEYVLWRFAPRGNRESALMLDFVREIQDAVLFANGIKDWDWLEAVGDSYIPDRATRGYDKQDRLLPLKRWWPELPPFPLDIVPRHGD